MNQPDPNLMIVSSRARADKAINSLKGILEGINIDGDVNQNEINELYLWAKEHSELIQRKPFNEFLESIEYITQYENPNSETIEELFYLCQKYESENYYYNSISADLQTLQGICHGILADGEITEEEVFNLHKWLENNSHLNSYYPYDEISSIVLSIVSDHKVDDQERLVLKAYFNEFVRLYDPAMDQKVKDDTADINIAALCTSNPDISFDGKTFVTTGIFKRKFREQLENEIRDLGGIVAPSVTKKTDYLIVASEASPLWAFDCYGRKVERARALRKTGHTITIVHEFDLCDIIDDL